MFDHRVARVELAAVNYVTDRGTVPLADLLAHCTSIDDAPEVVSRALSHAQSMGRLSLDHERVMRVGDSQCFRHDLLHFEYRCTCFPPIDPVVELRTLCAERDEARRQLAVIKTMAKYLRKRRSVYGDSESAIDVIRQTLGGVE